MNSFVEKEEEEWRSPEIQEIIGHGPSNILRFGIGVIFMAVFALLFLSWFIKYPDLVSANVIITTSPPPTAIVSRVNGNLILLKADNEKIKAGELIGYIQSNVSLESIVFVEKRLDSPDALLSVPAPESLGELHPHYAQLISSLTNLKAFTENKIFSIQIEQLGKQVLTYTKLQKTLARQKALMVQELELSKNKFGTDSLLFIAKVTSALDFNNAKIAWLQQQRVTQISQTALLNNEVQVNQLHQQIADLRIRETEELQKLKLQVQQNNEELTAQIDRWKKAYVFIAPMDGTLAYLGFLEMHQNLDANTAVFSIMPSSGKLIAKAELPIRGSGKVKKGQRVNIRLENYPFEQYGILQGVVSGISEMRGEEKYWVTITLPNQLLTNQNKQLQFKQQLSGTTEIITEDLRLLERFLYQIRKLLQTRS
ncbi:HlyD family efflux transporter periplasmic adaptor subunit [soil metagenome]